MTINNDVSLENVKSTVRQLLENGGKEEQVVLRKPGKSVKLVLGVGKNKKDVVVVFMSVFAKLDGKWYMTESGILESSTILGDENKISSFAKDAVAQYEAALNKRRGWKKAIKETIKNNYKSSTAAIITAAVLADGLTGRTASRALDGGLGRAADGINYNVNKLLTFLENVTAPPTK